MKMNDDQAIEDQAVEDQAVEDQAVSECPDLDMQGRLWLRAVIALLEHRPSEPDQNGRVQFALDRLAVAACERATRILRSDLPADAA